MVAVASSYRSDACRWLSCKERRSVYKHLLRLGAAQSAGWIQLFVRADAEAEAGASSLAADPPTENKRAPPNSSTSVDTSGGGGGDRLIDDSLVRPTQSDGPLARA